jgi:hypothetical protein
MPHSNPQQSGGVSLPVGVSDGGTGATTQAGARTNLGLGTAATKNAGKQGGQVLLLDASSPAIGTITMSGVPFEDETFTIHTVTFTWKPTRTGTGEVTIGADAAECCTNLIAAIGADIDSWTLSAMQGTGTTVRCISTFTSLDNNQIVFESGSTNMAMDGSGKLGGTQKADPGGLPAVNASKLTALNATQLTSGTIPDARFPAILPAVSGANLTDLPASGFTPGYANLVHNGTWTSYATVALAMAAAVSGDRIVACGDFVNDYVTLKDKVNIKYLAGSRLKGGSYTPWFTDGGIGVEVEISGSPRLEGMNPWEESYSRLVELTAASSTVIANFGKIKHAAYTLVTAANGAKAYITIEGNSTSVSCNPIVCYGGSFVDFTFDSLIVDRDFSYVNDNNAKCVLRGKQLTSSAANTFFYVGDTGQPECEAYIDSIINTNASFAGGIATAKTGKLKIWSNEIAFAGGVPLKRGNGAIEINNARLVSTKDDATGGAAIDMDDGTTTTGKVTLKDCVLIAHANATASINATGAVDLFSNSALLANKDKDANVTIKGGAFTYNSDVL